MSQPHDCEPWTSVTSTNELLSTDKTDWISIVFSSFWINFQMKYFTFCPCLVQNSLQTPHFFQVSLLQIIKIFFLLAIQVICIGFQMYFFCHTHIAVLSIRWWRYSDVWSIKACVCDKKNTCVFIDDTPIKYSPQWFTM